MYCHYCLSDVIVTGSMAWHVVEVKTMTLAAQWCCNLKCIKSCFALGKGSSVTLLIILLYILGRENASKKYINWESEASLSL